YAMFQQIKPTRSWSRYYVAVGTPSTAMTSAEKFLSLCVDRAAKVRADAGKDLDTIALAYNPNRTLRLELSPPRVLRDRHAFLDQFPFFNPAQGAEIGPVCLARFRKSGQDRITANCHPQDNSDASSDQSGKYAQ